MGRLDHVFVLQIHHDQFIFAIITPVEATGGRDEVLDLTVYRLTDRATIIGIPAISPYKPYMVPVAKVGIVKVDWFVHTM